MPRWIWIIKQMEVYTTTSRVEETFKSVTGTLWQRGTLALDRSNSRNDLAPYTYNDVWRLPAMMYQQWELCDDTFTEWSADNKITLPAKPTLRTVAAKYLYSDWVWLMCYDSQIGYTNIPHP